VYRGVPRLRLSLRLNHERPHVINGCPKSTLWTTKGRWLKLENHLVGSKARPTFEIGGPSGSSDIGPANGLVLIPHQAKNYMPIRVEPQTEMDNPGQLDLVLTRACVDGQAAIERKDTCQGEIAHHMGWFF
jgi:hypothetical protein